MTAPDTTPGTGTDAAPVRRKQRRTWPQRTMLLLMCLGAIACFAAAGAIATGQWVLSQRNLVTLADVPTARETASEPAVVLPDASSEAGADATLPSATTVPLVLAEPQAANFLVVGADNNDCTENPVTEDRSDLGERSDTIMVWRANPDTNQLAVLSFPRDLYVDYPSGNTRRINEAFERNNPARLQEVIAYNFGIEIDHYIQIDFCAFRRLVDAVGGVEIPFELPARDQPRSGSPPLFLVPEPGCVNLDGDTALAYVRSRYYQSEDPPGSGNWVTDGTSDFGRISRQQDFLRRMLGKVIDEGLYDPDVATALIATNRKYLVTDTDLTVRRMLEFANALRSFDASQVTSYRIESSSATRGGASVEIPRIENDNMQAILAIFRGEATLASAPEQDLSATTTTSIELGGAATTSTTADDDASSSDEASDETGSVQPTTTTTPGVAASTLPTVDAEENLIGQAPDRTLTCD